MTTFAWREGVVHWERHGHGPPVVLCHGTPWSSQLWDHLTAELAEHRTVYRWDMIGFGRSEQRDSQQVSLAVQGELLTDLLRHWDLDRPDIVAHDIGGTVALRAQLLHGCSFRSQILIDVVAVAPWGSPFFTLVRDHAEVFTQLPANLHRALVEEYIRGASHRGLTAEQLAMLTMPWLGETGQAAFYRQIAQAEQQHTDEIEPRYPQISIPTHLIWGAEDTWIPLARGKELAARIPGAQLTVIDGAGHLVQLDAPERLNETVLALLTKD